MIYMHGGFENETPNIPTNSIMKLDLIAHVKTNTQLLQKLESAFANNKAGNANSTKASTETPSSSQNTRASTPPIQALVKNNHKIRMGKGEIV